MRIIKVNATNSTNDFVRELFRENKALGLCCVVTENQTHGRGQRGAGWSSKTGENLTFSIFYPGVPLGVNRQFLLSAGVSVAVAESLSHFEVPEIKVKWPNDIMAGNYKIGGILIENILKNNKIAASVIGIGLNVNQEIFEDLPKASSLKKITAKSFDLQEVLENVVFAIEAKLRQNFQQKENIILEEYLQKLFRKDKVSAFQLPDGEYFNGIIRGVTTAGKLQIERENAVRETFDLKEVKLMY